mgnify:FL=1
MTLSFSPLIGLGLSLWRWPAHRVRLLDGAALVLSGSLLGARADHVLLHGPDYFQHPGEIPRLWSGGLGWAGGLAGGVLAVLILARFTRYSLGVWADALTPVLGVLAGGLWLTTLWTGSWYGGLTEAWWGIPVRDELGRAAARVPLPLVGAVASVGFTLLGELGRGRKGLSRPGQKGLLTVGTVSLVIFALSFARVDPGPGGYGLRRSAWTGLVFSLAALSGYLILWRYYAMKPLSIHPQDATNTLVNFIKKTFTDAGLERAVLGVSGGVDSALSAFLTVKALGPDNVLLLRLPYQTSSPSSLEHAQRVIEYTGAESATYEITEGVEGILQLIPEADQVRRGNVMARVRMAVIYDQAAATGGLVVGTGNKTEILLGYSTLHGDAAFDLNPLADLYKAQVRKLASFLEVPQEIIDKAPSADLWEGQTDEDELGFTYQRVDPLLYALVEEGQTRGQVVKEGFEEDFVDEVIDRVMAYRFKSQPPPAASIGQRPVSELEELPAFGE